jgi:hypothetical protein
MKNNKYGPNNKFGPQNKKEELIFAQEEFRVLVQVELFKLMNRRGYTTASLAKKLKTDIQSINCIFDSDFYLDVLTLGKIFYILGVKCNLSFEDLK